MLPAPPAQFHVPAEVGAAERALETDHPVDGVGHRRRGRRGAAEHHRLGPDSSAIHVSSAIVSSASSHSSAPNRRPGTLRSRPAGGAAGPHGSTHSRRGLFPPTAPAQPPGAGPQGQQPPVLDRCRRAAPRRHAQRAERDSLGHAAILHHSERRALPPLAGCGAVNILAGRVWLTPLVGGVVGVDLGWRRFGAGALAPTLTDATFADTVSWRHRRQQPTAACPFP